jgi:YidC/Oxa1 family membrane protein insertase
MKKQIKLLLVVFSIFILTGCTTYLKDSDKKAVKYDKTGQTLTKNILCKPEDEEILAIYEEYNKQAKEEAKINLEELPSCESMKLTGKYEGLWTNVFVKPLAIIIVKVGNLLNSYGLALILITILIRAIVWPLTGKAAKQSENMKKAQPELEKLEKKYKNKTDQEAMMQKSQEMLMIYKKYNINPMSGCLFSFIQIPLFFAFYEAISRIPVIFEETFLGFQLGTSPLTAVFAGHYQYLIFIVLIAGATYYSFKLNMQSTAMSSEQQQQMKQMNLFMVVFMTFASFSISSGIAIYWVTSNLFTIFQNLIMKRGKKHVK